MSDEIKELLGRAIGAEPPLGIDRDEVFRAGRKQARRRRALASGGVVAAVVVAAVGATTLTNFVSVEPEPVPPAVGDSRHAPPGPELPLPPKSEPQRPPESGVPRSADHAAQLTQLLYESGFVSPDVAMPWPGRAGSPGFRVDEGVYLYEADITGPDGEGVLQVTVDVARTGVAASCDDIGGQFDTCEVTKKDGNAVAEATWKSGEGERRNLAVVVLPDGTKVAAMSSNFSRRFADYGKRPTGDQPVLDMAALTTLLVNPGFSVF